MREGWKNVELGDLVTFQRGHDLAKSEFIDGQYPIAGSNGVIGYHNQYTTRGPSITIGRSGNLGTPYYYEDDFWAHNTTLFVKEFHKSDPKFIYYLLKTHDFKQFNSGSAVPSLNRNYIHPLEVCVPENIDTQRRIAALLSALDDKIELNRQTNQTLEAIAQTLFKEWFVDFNFPGATGEMQESELGPIPVGWEVSTLKNLTVKIGSGATPRGGSGVYLDEGTALIRSQNVYDSEFVWNGLARISDEAAEQLRCVEVKQDDVLLNITGASILRTCVVVPEVLPARVNQHVAIIRANPGIPSRYIHLHLLQQKTKDYLMALDAGGSREAVTKGHIELVPILKPPLELLARFDAVSSSAYSEIEQLSSQIRALASTRDILLPKLMSGEIVP